MKKLCFFILLTLGILKSDGVNRCDRTPDSPIKPKNTEEIDKYIIEISDDPSTYIPGDTYTVTLKYNPLMGGFHMFRDFMLSVEQANIENTFETDDVHVGVLKLSEDMLSAFSRKCENTILQTSSVSKSSIKVYWIAPQAGSGCVAFRATVIESKENWFMDDGGLTKILCEEISENEDVQPPILDECTACDEAKYELIFEGLWTRNTHPKNYPSNYWFTRLGDIVGASHANNQSFWEYEQYASENIKNLAEYGITIGLEMELKEKMGKTVRTIIKANGLRYPNITGKTFTFFRVDRRNHLVSFVSKITPSPDWILGVSNFELCRSDGTWSEQRILNLYPWDIGTDDGILYNSRNEPRVPHEKIRKIQTDIIESPFYDPDGKDLKPFAKIYFKRLKTYKKDCRKNPWELSTEEGQSKECATTPWSEWSSCSEKCGKGAMFQRREYVFPENGDICKEELVRREKCVGKKCKNFNQDFQGLLPINDPKCELTDWNEWSSCSVACGRGTMTREKKFVHPEYSMQCENNDPSILQYNQECTVKEDDCIPYEEPKECEELAWGPWTSCTVTCGIGTKTRLRMPRDEEDEDVETECKNMEEVKCFEPLCENSTNGYGDMISLNQVTTDNIFSQPFGPVLNCKVSNWSVWGPCELNNRKCGRGYRTQHRQILQHAMNGGKACPRKLMRRKGCVIPCHQDIKEISRETSTRSDISSYERTEIRSDDCIMSPWSSWSPCSSICGSSAVQQRTRSIRRPARGNGKPCGPRLDQKPCPLPLACSDKGIPIM